MSRGEVWWRERDDVLGVAQALRMRRLHRERSPYQEIEVWEHAALGRVLVLEDRDAMTERGRSPRRAGHPPAP